MQIRPGHAGDAEAIAAIVVECDRTFVSFAPDGWQPPSYQRELEHARDAIARPNGWVAVAERGDGPLGYATLIAASATRMPVDDPQLAHLGRLFVRPTHWGAGVATALHDAAVAEAAGRGFARMRLFTPTCHGRARRFYEREGWRAVTEMPDSTLGLPIIEYRRDL